MHVLRFTTYVKYYMVLKNNKIEIMKSTSDYIKFLGWNIFYLYYFDGLLIIGIKNPRIFQCSSSTKVLQKNYSHGHSMIPIKSP